MIWTQNCAGNTSKAGRHGAPMRALNLILAVIVTVCAAVIPSAFAATPYDAAGQRAADWLVANMIPADKSWGSEQDLKYLTAAEVSLALASWDRRSYEYYAALTWLSNHTPVNLDFVARRVLALAPSGQSVANDLNALSTAQSFNLIAPGNGGFGLGADYQGSPLDTAFALQAYNVSGTSANVAAATAFLKNAQLTGSDHGWAIGQESSSDPITTAEVLIALIPYRSTDSTLAAPIANGLATLNSVVTSSSTPLKKSLAALADLRDNASSSQASSLLSNLMSTQGGDGSWGGDVQATAIALRALAAAAGRDAPSLKTPVAIDDTNLRAAINAALSRNALDTLNQGELAQLTSLNISGQGVTDLSGLQYAANLTFVDASYNNITSWSPVTSLPQNPTVVRDGNPGYPVDTGDAPTLPEWAAILLGGLLLLISHRQFSIQKRPRIYPEKLL